MLNVYSVKTLFGSERTCLKELESINTLGCLVSGLSIIDTQADSNQTIFEEKEVLKKSNLTTFEDKQAFVKKVVQAHFDRNLVIRFIQACPSQKDLATATGLSTSTISKLKNPAQYGQLELSAKLLWSWVSSKEIEVLKEKLMLSNTLLEAMADSLSMINLANCNIVYAELGKSVQAQSGFIKDVRLVKDVVECLHSMKGTFTKLDLSNNLLSDEGLSAVAAELKEHTDLVEINLCNNKISDKGLQSYLKWLLLLPHLKMLDISQNFGPSDETLNVLCEDSKELKAKIKY